MSIMFCFRGPFDKWHSKLAETLLKSEQQYLNHLSLWRQFRLKKSLWVIWKILGLFVNPLPVDGKYSLLNRSNLSQHFQMQLSQKPKTFSEFLFHILNLASILNILEKKMTLIANLYLNLRTLKYVDRSMSKKSRFRRPFDK